MTHLVLVVFLGQPAFPRVAFLLDFEASGAVVAAAEFDDVLAKAAQEAELALAVVGGLAVPIGQGGGVVGGEDGGEVLDQDAVGCAG